MKTLLIAALMVLDSGATEKKHHHGHHHTHGHKNDLNLKVSASLAEQGHKSEAF
jgi:hypothetical protein